MTLTEGKSDGGRDKVFLGLKLLIKIHACAALHVLWYVKNKESERYSATFPGTYNEILTYPSSLIMGDSIKP